jgi:hypothetical protein
LVSMVTGDELLEDTWEDAMEDGTAMRNQNSI